MKKRKCVKWSEEEIKLVRENYEFLTDKELASMIYEKLGIKRSATSIARTRHGHGLIKFRKKGEKNKKLKIKKAYKIPDKCNQCGKDLVELIGEQKLLRCAKWCSRCNLYYTKQGLFTTNSDGVVMEVVDYGG